MSMAGYSWKTNQYGLAVDTVVAFELVKPNGEVVKVTESSEPDLFFGLRVSFLTTVSLYGAVANLLQGRAKQLCERCNGNC